ncbi:MAG: PmeII family type II restriction endonuclease [Infirmifilum sp.]|jgi:hypothetical protein
MSEKDKEFIAILLEESKKFNRQRARTVSSFFEDFYDFCSATEETLSDLKQHSQKPLLKKEEIEAIVEIIRSGLIDCSKTLPENFIAAISRNFIKRQLDMIRSLTLYSLNPNPFLIQSLKLSTPEEVIRLNVYAAVTRSIVTSFGLIIENMLAATSESVQKIKSGWDLLKIKDGIKHWIQVKSGPNDMDKDQIEFWRTKIEEVEERGERGYIGFTYGKKDNNTVTIDLLKQYLPDYEMRTLIGRELWDFLSDDPNMHSKVLDILRQEALRILKDKNIINEVEDCINRLKNEFLEKYGEGYEGVRKYINDIF